MSLRPLTHVLRTRAAAAPSLARTLRTSAVRCDAEGASAKTEDPLLATIRQKMKEAMRARKKGEADVWRSIIGAHNQQQHSSSPPPLSRLLQSAYDQRLTSASAYRSAKPSPRHDLAEAEEAEAALLKPLLPELLGDAELKAAVEEVVKQGAGRMGEAMKAMKEKYPAEDGKRVAGFVKEALKA